MHSARNCKTSSLLTASPVLAWFFVAVWGSGYIASKTGLQYVPPFTFPVVALCRRTVRYSCRSRSTWQQREPLRCR